MVSVMSDGSINCVIFSTAYRIAPFTNDNRNQVRKQFQRERNDRQNRTQHGIENHYQNANDDHRLYPAGYFKFTGNQFRQQIHHGNIDDGGQNQPKGEEPCLAIGEK